MTHVLHGLCKILSNLTALNASKLSSPAFCAVIKMLYIGKFFSDFVFSRKVP